MKILFNVGVDEKRYQKAISYLASSLGFTPMVTTKTLSVYSAQALARQFNAEAVIICNEHTLEQHVDDPKPTLSNWRGSRLATQIPTFVVDKIANVYSTAEGRWLFDRDLLKVKQSFKAIRPFAPTILKTIPLVRRAYSELQSAVLIGIDIETQQHQMKKHAKSSTRVPCFNAESMDIKGLGETWITVVSITSVMPNGELKTYVLPVVNGMHDYWTDDSEYGYVLDFIRKVCDLDAPKVFHNGLYDCFHLLRYGAYPREWLFDTMGLSHSQFSELPKTLDFLSSWTNYDHRYWKYLADKEHKATGSMEDYWTYAGLDTYRMMQSLMGLIDQGDYWMWSNYKAAFPLVYPSCYAAFEGMKIDNETRFRLQSSALEELESARTDLQIMTDDPEFNPASPPQTSEFLYNVLGAARPKRAKSKSATGAKERVFVAGQHPINALFVDRFNVFAHNAKAISTYYNYLQWNSRLMFSLDPFGTETGRFASRGSPAWIGTQIQNQPYYAKEMYIPDPGYVLFEIDYSKAEAICTAFLCQSLALIKALTDPDLDSNGNKKDFYRVLGELFFQMKYEDVTTEFRNKVLKRIQHGTNYMMAEDTFIEGMEDISVLYYAAQQLGITISVNPSALDGEMSMKNFAKHLLDSYHIPFPEVKVWWEDIMNEVITTGKVINPATGHVRVFFGDPKKDRRIQRKAVAHQSQNCSVAELNKGFLRAWHYACSLPSSDILRLKTQIHDSILGQVKIEWAREVIPKVAELAIARLDIHGRPMTINVDIECSATNWKDKEEWETFSTTTLATLERQKSLMSTTDGLLSV